MPLSVIFCIEADTPSSFCVSRLEYTLGKRSHPLGLENVSDVLIIPGVHAGDEWRVEVQTEPSCVLPRTVGWRGRKEKE